MGIYIAKSDEAQELLEDEEFGRKWKELFEKCPWATVFQDFEYLSIWNRNYKNACETFLIYETDAADELTGLFPLARRLKTGKIFAMGDYHAEYQTWLATPENGDRFAEKAFDLLVAEFPDQRLQMLFLAPNTPLNWIKGRWTKQTRLLPLPRPIVKLSGENPPAKSLKKKGNKSRIRQLKKKGELEFAEVTCPIKFSKLFDQAENFSRLRVSGIHDVQTEKDENRKKFHLDLMNETDVVYPTALKINDEIVSAQVCFRNRGEMLLCITAMSPFYAKQSPSKIHLLMLGNLLAEKGYESFDLSPGNGYKERFATDIEETHALDIFFNKADAAKFKTRRKIAKFGRKTLEKFNFTKSRLFRIGDRLLHKLKRVRLSTIPGTILKNIGLKIYECKEVRMYSFDVERIIDIENRGTMNVDSVSDLLKYKPVEGWQDTTSQFHQKVLRNFEAGIHSYSYAEDETLLHYGWLIERQEVSNVFEVGQEFNLPPNTSVLFDYYTHPKARGKGLYQKSLLQGLHDAAKIPETEQVFIGVIADNAPSRHVIEKLGFKYEGSLFRETRLGFVKKWQNWSENSQINEKEPALEESYSI